MSFKSVAKSISSKEHIPINRARAILAVSSRNSSVASKRHNPKLKRVMGKKK